MKISELKQLIKEEIQRTLNEAATIKPLDLDYTKFEQIMNKAVDPKTYANIPDLEGDSPFFEDPKTAKNWLVGVKMLELVIKKQKKFKKKEVVPLFHTFDSFNMIEDLPLGKKWAKINDAFDVLTFVLSDGWDEDEGIAAWNQLVQAVNSFKL